MFEVKGEHSQKAVEALRSSYEHRTTRVDVCADFDHPGAFEALLGPCIEIKKDRRIMGGKAGDWDDFPEREELSILAVKTAQSGCACMRKVCSLSIFI